MSLDASTAIPLAVREQLTQPTDVEAAVAAMKLFIAEGNEATFESCVNLYCTAAQGRQESIECVLAVLCKLANDLEKLPRETERLAKPSALHVRLLAGVLRAFYGHPAVDREDGASAQRKADAAQHLKAGTWPKRPA